MSSEPKVVGYCRQCGKALDESNVRAAHGTIYCEEHVPMTPPMSMPNPETVPPVDASPYANPYTAPTAPPPMPGTQGYPGQVAPGQISPGLAFGLGLIPGVGAIYNGQYAKGLTHVVIFGLFISILDSGAANGYEPLVALLMAGFCCYMPFEAYHTALRRQRGQIEDEFSSLLPVHGSSRFPVAPVVLIALGTIFLLHNMNLLDFERWLRYWPVLLIALGAYMLIARMNTSGSSGSRSGAAERPHDGGGEQ
jgi:hypothetical protein